MFYSQFVLAKKGPLGKIWLAAHMENKVPKLQIISTNIPESVGNIENPALPMALRVSGHLLLGVVRIFSKKVTYLLTDCSEALVKIKDAFRAPGPVDLPQGATTRRYEDITNPDQFDEMELEVDLASQEMSFALSGDEALVGISIPDVAIEGSFAIEDEPASQLLSASQAMEEGFGASDNFEVFFDTKALDEEEPQEKRRRRSEPEEPSSAGTDPENSFPDVEQFRSADDSELFDIPAIPVVEAVEEQLVQTTFDEPDDMFMEPEVFDAEVPSAKRSSLEAAMTVEEEPVYDASQPPQQSQNGVAAPKQRRGIKRRMVVDDQVMLSADFMRKQLRDTSKIVRDISSIPISKTSRPPRTSPFSGPPSLSFLPASVANMACFQLQVGTDAMKRSRGTSKHLDVESEAQPAEQLNDFQEDDLRDDEPEQWRKAETGEVGDGLEDPLTFSGSPKPDEDSPAELVTFDEPDDMISPPEIESAEPFEEQSLAFEGSHQLPNVDTSSESVLLTRGVKSSKKNQKVLSQLDPEAWSKRTHNMYVTLGSAFEESEGQPLSYDAMVAQTLCKEKRRVVAGCFQELLFLASKGLIDLEQAKPYANIVVSKTELFETIQVQAS